MLMLLTQKVEEQKQNLQALEEQHVKNLWFLSTAINLILQQKMKKKFVLNYIRLCSHSEVM